MDNKFYKMKKENPSRRFEPVIITSIYAWSEKGRARVRNNSPNAVITEGLKGIILSYKTTNSTGRVYYILFENGQYLSMNECYFTCNNKEGLKRIEKQGDKRCLIKKE